MAEFALKSSNDLIGQSVEIGGVNLTCHQPVNILSIAPFKGQGMAVNDVLKAAIKFGLPTVGTVKKRGNTRIMWAGQGLWFITGAFDIGLLSKALEQYAAITDQSDGWITFTVCGRDAVAVMSRLCSLDLSKMELGQTARAEFAHMMSGITPVIDGFEVMIMRSFARTANDKTLAAMTKLAALRAL